MSENNPNDMVKVFEKQYDILQEQITNFQKRLDALEVVIKEARESRTISLEKIMTILELMREGNPYIFVVRYFSVEQIKTLMKHTTQRNQGFVDRTSRVFSQLSRLYAEKARPDSPDAQKLAQEWWSMVQDFTGGNKQLLRTLISVGNDMDNWPKEAGNIKTMMQEFLSPTLSLYFQKHNIHIDDLDNLKEGSI